jgi:mannan endo-1,4-beta-mannosidase
VILNAFYLQEEAARGRVEVLDETFAAARALGADWVRAWAFNADPNKRGDTAIHVAPGTFDERGLSGLDLVLERAAAAGVRLVLSLFDHWSSYGGAQQILRWTGVPDATDGDPRFYTESPARTEYAAWVTTLLQRENPRTGRRYGADPTVAAWELCNEPRGRQTASAGEAAAPSGRELNLCGAAALTDWVRFAAGIVRAHASQPIAAGDEGEDISLAGFDAAAWTRMGGAHLFAPSTGTSFTAHLPYVDFASVHFYPHKYGIPAEHAAEAGERWIREHAAVAAAHGRPLLVGELGIARGYLAEDARIDAYRRWLRAAREVGARAGLWLFVTRDRPRAWEPLSFGLDDPEAAAYL